MSEVVACRLRLVGAMIRAELDPAAVAREARTLLADNLVMFLDTPVSTIPEGVQLELRRLQMQVWELRLPWTDFTSLHKIYFEADILDRMNAFFMLVAEATKIVQLRALDALQDPANWPFDPDLSPQADVNVEAAKAHGVTYDSEKRQYLDEDGHPKYDHFGQPL
jgi:hypothetical protein